MNDQQRADKLKQWIKPSSNDEQLQQDRALRMVTEAIESSDLGDLRYEIYAKGSYANQTNVRRDSDVDIAVDCHECLYYESFPEVSPKVSKSPYTGPYTGLAWRSAVETALREKFGSDLDGTGTVAFHLDAVAGSRPNIDIVPGYQFRKFRDSQGQTWFDGSKVFTSDGKTVLNWPQQQLDNGKAKDLATAGRYKQLTRALKSAENVLALSGALSDKPSFMMECLMYNVNNDTLRRGDLVQAFRASLSELWVGLSNNTVYGSWLEPNHRKWAIRGQKKWSVSDAREVVSGAWDLLEFS